MGGESFSLLSVFAVTPIFRLRTQRGPEATDQRDCGFADLARELFLGIIVLLAFPATMWAQVAASISGKVVDASGAAVNGATVTVREMETDAKRVATTDAAGNYHFLSLPVGIYELSAEKSGFETQLWSGIRLNVDQEVVENVRLAVSGSAQEITVSATNPVVNTTTSSVSGLVGEEEIKDLPLNGRSFDDLITLNPGTVNYSGLRSANTTTSNGSAFAVDGQKPGDNETLLNGVEYGGASQLEVTPGGVSGLLLGVDAVREFNLETGTYGSRVRQALGSPSQRRDPVRQQRSAWHPL